METGHMEGKATTRFSKILYNDGNSYSLYILAHIDTPADDGHTDTEIAERILNVVQERLDSITEDLLVLNMLELDTCES